MTASGARETSHLGRLARAYGVQSVYYGIPHRRIRVSPQTLLAVLKALGAPLERAGDARDALREHEQARWRRPCDPVVVAWDGGSVELSLRLPRTLSDTRIGLHLRLEDGGVLHLPCDLSLLPAAQGAQVEGERYVVKTVDLPEGIPLGYHRLTAEIGGNTMETVVIAAPRKACESRKGTGGRTWGVFLPLYSLNSRRRTGSGDLTDLAALMEWVSG